jgi:hypothetical protein
MVIIKRIAITFYILFLLYLAGFGIGSAAREEMLIQIALPFAVILIIAVRLLGEKSELAGWAVFTVWLGSTYLQTGQTIETIIFVVYIGIALLGAFKSPYFLAAAWLFHPVWDFVPRELPDLLKDLPTACIMFDIPIGLYILWFTRNNRWMPFGKKVNKPASETNQ